MDRCINYDLTSSVDDLGAMSIEYEGQPYSYSSFFASSHMADLASLANELTFYLRASSNFVHEAYVPGYASVYEESSLQEFEEAEDLLQRLCEPVAERVRTSLIFLQGRAGDGKSSLLTNYSYEAARQYELGKIAWLPFYIDAQGRALARTDEAVALITQDLRAKFTYHGLSTLTRLGLVVPIIDGFDELLGSGGYDDAFASLEVLIRKLQGKGSIVASARSTFYKYSALGRQSSRFTGDRADIALQIIPIHLREWTIREAAKYFLERGAGSGLHLKSLKDVEVYLRDQLGAATAEITSSPFLMSHVASHVIGGGQLSPDDNFLGKVIRELVERELSAKILDTQGHRILSEAQHSELLGSLAEEMWWQETRVVDEDTLATLVDVTCDDLNIPEDSAKILIQKLPSHAVLSRSDRPARVSFRHEYYYGFFLAGFLASRLISNEALGRVLGRSTISQPIASQVAARFSEDEANRAIENLGAIYATPFSSLLALRNAGILAASILIKFNISDKVISELVFDAIDLSGVVIKNISFVQCVFVRCDFLSSVVSHCRFDRCEFQLPRMAETTKFIETELQVQSIQGFRYFEDGKTEEFYSPGEIFERLNTLGVKLEGEAFVADVVAPQIEKQVLDFLRLVERTFVFSESDFENKKRKFAEFSDIVRAGLRSGVITESKKSVGGGTRDLYRLNEEADRIRFGLGGIYLSEEIREFWKELSDE